ncbi:DUF1127 domain-containing protein [Azospirillum brasilense]|uniref:DUF1127 domain-containing protein n=1 Tax=Azospirillum brasilense TaxID=192 RepID=A0A0N7I7D5_AZOBR|nr:MULTISPECIES: DUF1127 domain-containing protein [Azospirillum]ALJ34187.1 hypothetical protein AMK58_01445 [Azospirillum brasilense]MDW7552829.1 DUF1127 domain-containing protein [Azospirillum brasilense]MDW7591979.1 DUF1127 domain-containing protein [Azospirillum brasilense]MDW7627744.1 DUF1127 domain-containing protein [Azospirillum brasilense]MDX5952787.1 DUF1127 domain-containing protein [Azospirillum brasilense]
MTLHVFPRTGPPQARLRTLLAWIARTREERRQRAELLSLSDHELRDIGITRYDALTEARKGLWR